MKNGLFLSDVLDTSDFVYGSMNIIVAPCGCGKTTAAINRIASLASSPKKALYLIDTRNGCQRLAMDEKLKLPHTYYDDSIEKHHFSFEKEEDAVVVTTYAQFGSWVSRYPEFAENFEVIICDEVHNLFYFSKFSTEPSPASKARDALCAASYSHTTMVVGITATPKVLDKLWCRKNYLPIDASVLRQYEVKNTVYYDEIDKLLPALPENSIGALYIGSVNQLREYTKKLQQLGRRPIAIWSESHACVMTKEQYAAR